MSAHRHILNFHGLGDPPSHIAPDERSYWIGAAFFTDIVSMVLDEFEPGRVGFTFDDGNRSDHDIAAPVLAGHGLAGTFFVLAGRLGHPGYLGRDDLVALRRSGMTIGLHGRNHVDWRRLDDAALSDETDAARVELEDASGAPVDHAGIPFGAYDARVMRWLCARSFATIQTSDGGPARAGARILPRTSVRQDMDMAAVRQILSGREGAVRKVRRTVSMALRRHVI